MAGGALQRVSRIVSGGQTGPDRAALDAAIAHAVPAGGWCPYGGWAEDHPRPPGLLARYPMLRPTPAGGTAQRTAWNVRDADALLVLTLGDASSPGTAAAERLALELGRPLLRVDLTLGDDGPLRAWLHALPDGTALNVAGPRESEAPGISAAARELLERLLQPPTTSTVA